MTQMTDTPTTPTIPDTDLTADLQRVLAAADEPLTVPKIRSQLPTQLRAMSLEELTEALRRQVAAGVLIQYPKYRSQQDRFWDRPMPVHIAALLRFTLAEGPLALSELRRKLPAYAVPQAEAVLQEQVAQGLLYRHPPAGKRGGDRFGAQRPDPKEYLRSELVILFRRLEQLGFTEAQLREGALELLHEEEWSRLPEQVSTTEAPAPTPAAEAIPPAASPSAVVSPEYSQSPIQ